jgi:putative transposase
MSKLNLVKTSHAVSQIGLHIVWCTKYRHPVLKDGVDVTVKRVIGEACVAYGWQCHVLEVMPEHVHLFIQIGHTDSPCNVAKTLKSLTAISVFTIYPKLKSQKFWGSGLWSDGTFYSSVDGVSQETVAKYISEQKNK